MRVFDIVAAVASLLLLSPVFIGTAVLLKLTSRGPVIYSQRRVGLNGRLFSLYKFRSMVVGADKIGTSVTAGTDPRITKAGRFLRKTKLDELPQVWNVLKGDMSFVGPRPEVPEIVDKYSGQMRRILSVRPGITSNASLHLRNEEDLLSEASDPDKAYELIFVPAKVDMAMEHVDRRSFFFDFKILLQTIWLVAGGRIKQHPIVKEMQGKVKALNANMSRGDASRTAL